MALPKFTLTSSLSLAGVVVLVGGLGIAIFASQHQQNTKSKAAEFSTESVTVNIDCTQSSGQICLPRYNKVVQTQSVLKVKFTPASYSCSAARYRIYVDGIDKALSNWVGWSGAPAPYNGYPLTTGDLDVGPVMPGTHIISIQVEGQVSGCNEGRIGTWIGTADITTSTTVSNPPPTETQKAELINYVSCSSTGQLCSPPYTISVTTPNAVLKGSLTVEPLSCSSAKFHYFVDGVEKGVSDWLGWLNAPAPYNGLSLTTATIDLGQVTAGTHTVGIQAEGRESGCNVGRVGSWGAIAVVTTSNVAAPTITPTITPTQSSQTKFNLDLLFHGIGKGGDNRNPSGGGNPTPLHPTRSVVIDVYDFDDNVIIGNKQGEVTFDPVSGTYKGTVEMGTVLTTQAYVIKVKLSHSLRGSISRNITAGTTNAIPVITLVNGDTNNDAKLDIEDYNIIQGCYSDFDLPPSDCNVTKKTQADIDDDGKVNQFDLNLFLREMSVQQL